MHALKRAHTSLPAALMVIVCNYAEKFRDESFHILHDLGAWKIYFSVYYGGSTASEQLQNDTKV